MRKIYFLLAFLLACSVGYSAPTASLSEVLEWKYGAVADTCQVGEKMVICGWRSQEPKPSDVEVEVITQEYLDSQDYWVKRFNPELAIAREAQIFDATSLVRLMPYSYTLNEIIRFKNFCGGIAAGVPYAGLKQVGQALVAGEQILEQDYVALSNILLEQGVDLEACA